MKSKVSVNRYNVMEAMESVVAARGYSTTARGSMFDPAGNPYCIVGSVAVEMNAETKGKFHGGMHAFQSLFRNGYFEWADEREQAVVTKVLTEAMMDNDGAVSFGTILSKARERMRALAIERPASEAVRVIAKRIESAHFLSVATAN